MSEQGEDDIDDYYDEESPPEQDLPKPKRGALSFKKVPLQFVASGTQNPEPERVENKFKVTFREKKKEPKTQPLRFKNSQKKEAEEEIPSEQALTKKYGKGLKMLQKMGGFQVGQGIGKMNQGIINPVEAVGKEKLQQKTNDKKEKKHNLTYDQQIKKRQKLDEEEQEFLNLMRNTRKKQKTQIESFEEQQPLVDEYLFKPFTQQKEPLLLLTSLQKLESLKLKLKKQVKSALWQKDFIQQQIEQHEIESREVKMQILQEKEKIQRIKGFREVYEKVDGGDIESIKKLQKIDGQMYQKLKIGMQIVKKVKFLSDWKPEKQKLYQYEKYVFVREVMQLEQVIPSDDPLETAERERLIELRSTSVLYYLFDKYWVGAFRQFLFRTSDLQEIYDIVAQWQFIMPSEMMKKVYMTYIKPKFLSHYQDVWRVSEQLVVPWEDEEVLKVICQKMEAVMSNERQVIDGDRMSYYWTMLDAVEGKEKIMGEKLKKMIYVHIMPRLIYDFKQISKEFEGPLGKDIEKSRHLIEILQRFNRINQNSMEYVLCFNFLPELIKTLEQWIDIIQTDFSEAYQEAKQYILQWIEVLGKMPKKVEKMFQIAILKLRQSKLA